MKKFLVIVLLLFGAFSVSAQTNTAESPCALTVAQAPSINGLRLGMTVEEVLARFPGSSEDKSIAADRARAAAKFGAGTFTIIPEKYSSKSEFAGITQLNFRYIDGRIYSLRAGYNGPEWKSVDEFIAKFSEASNLPKASAWEATVGMETQMKSLKCGGVQITLFAGGAGGALNYAELSDTEGEKLLKDRRAKAREQEQKEAEKKQAQP
ncbi:MAG TPA: hypothetical protein VGC91_14225 [Pyrinomonadaceae bacterium]|jgi:hypothetical protein